MSMTFQEPRKVAVYLFSAQMLIDFLKEPRAFVMRIENPLPADARITGVNYDAISDYWEIGVWSNSHAIVPLGVRPPVMAPLVVQEIREAVPA